MAFDVIFNTPFQIWMAFNGDLSQNVTITDNRNFGFKFSLYIPSSNTPFRMTLYAPTGETVKVDWGDGNVSTSQYISGHTYINFPTGGDIYTVSIEGNIYSLSFNPSDIGLMIKIK